jgi:hypothetical protein
MNVEKTRIGTQGERDEEGYFGYHVIGDQYVFVDGNQWAVVVRLNLTSDEALICGGKVDAIFQSLVADHLKEKEGVKTVHFLRGDRVVSI